MNNEMNHKSKLKTYHIILLGCFLSFLLIANSNNVNNKRMTNKLNKEKTELFNKIIFGRRLETTSNPGQTLTQGDGEEEVEMYETDIVCLRASKELRDYYNNSATLKDLEISDGSIECKEKDEAYMKALIAIVKSLLGGDNEEEEVKEDEQQPSDNNDGGSRLRNLIEFNEEMKTNLITYGKSILPVIIALAMSILCIFGWIICCFCNCCNCCCCCCCKKPGCKIPCFLFTYVFYALAVAVCVYGLTQTNTIFTGLANTECSILRFFDEILYGEMKQTRPRWAGIEGINSILSELSTVITNMGESTYQALEEGMDNIADEEEAFELQLQNSGNEFYDNGNYMLGTFSKDYTGENKYISINVEVGGNTIKQNINLTGIFTLDLITRFGRYVQGDPNDETNNSHYEPEESVLYAWNYEYSTIAGFANRYMENARLGFQDILTRNLGKIQNTLNDAQGKFDDLKKPFDDIHGQISSSIYDYSKLIDDYGKIGVKYVFLALALLNILLAFFILLICMCSGKLCTNCCCCRCWCKFMTHLLWNILALLMIITFLVGSIIALIGKLGGDVMSIISFVMSQENFDSENPLLIDKLGSASQYLNCCLNGDGDIAGQLNLSNSIGSFDQIYEAQSRIDQAIENFTMVRDTHLAYNGAKDFYEKRIKYEEDFILLNNTADTIPIAFSMIIDLLNENIDEAKKEKWDYQNGDKTKTCSSDIDIDIDDHTNNIKFHPSTCKPNDRDWIEELRNKDQSQLTDKEKNILNYADLITDSVDIINNLNLFKDKIDTLLGSYQRYLGSFLTTLNTFSETIASITNILEDYIGHDTTQTFSFLNGKFIGTNLKIVLKYLKYSLGKDLYKVGLCLIIVGCSLIFSISVTILLIVIINISIDNNKMFGQEDDLNIAPYETEDNLNTDSNYRKPRRRSSRRKSNRNNY